MELSYCVVNTNGRNYLAACLDAIERTHPDGVDYELLVLDNASGDGSAELVRERAEANPRIRLIARERRTGKAVNDSELLGTARGRFCLLLNEDAELREGAVAALLEALRGDDEAAAAGAQLIAADGSPKACAWRLPGVGAALAVALFLHRRLVVQSRGERVRAVGWCQSSALLVRRRAAARIGYLDPDFFVYSDETDFCRRLGDAGWRILYVPGARAIHHDQLTTDGAAARRRIVEFHRGRDRYMRKHHSPPARIAARLLWTWSYLVRGAAAVAMPGHDPSRYLAHARQELLPGTGEGIREAAEAYNAGL